MRLISVETGRSPDRPQNARITGVAASKAGQRFEIWGEVDRAFMDALSTSGNPWLVALLPIAAELGEDIEIDLPTDALLLEGARGISRVWSKWYPDLSPVNITAPMKPAAPQPKGKTVAFFSGGVDSYFTIARRLPGNPFGLPVVGSIDDLITVQGFDLAVHDDANFNVLLDGVKRIADEIGINHFVARTNLRANRTPWMRRWGPLTYGAGLCFIGLLLENRYDEAVFGSAYPLQSAIPRGCHPMVDPYFSASNLRIVHDGATFTRVEKTHLIGHFPPAMKYLHVCQATGSANCSRCEKCCRTMATFDLLGMKDAARELFDWSQYSLERMSRVYMKANDIMYDEIIAAAKDAGRDDLLDALFLSRSRSRARRPAVSLAARLERIPGIWRVGAKLRQVALRHFITEGVVSHEQA